MVNTLMLQSHANVPMIYRRHGSTTPKPLSHVLGTKSTPNSYYVHRLRASGEDQLTTLNVPTVQSTAVSRNFGQVLRFGAYFLETVHESNMENYRVRFCEILFYLDDQTVQILEPKVENSGLVQGNFVKRHQVPLPLKDMEAEKGVSILTFRHFNVGQEVTIYGRTFRLISADSSTRKYLESQGIPVAPDDSAPRDAYTEARKAHMARETGQDMTVNYGKKQYPMKEYMEVRLGKFARPSEHLRQFLDHDRHVLRFYALWDDTDKLYGWQHRYTIHFFLADNTIEILESYERNSGCDPFPKLLNRTKLSRDDTKQLPNILLEQEVCEMTGKNMDTSYTWQDFAIGKYISVYQRDILLLDADENTRKWYLEKNEPLASAIIVPKCDLPGLPDKKEQKSVQSNSQSKRRFDGTNEEVLRFMAHLATTKPEDIDRRFIINLSLSDESISITEPVQRNAGFVGGKFLERRKVRDADDSDRFYRAEDFYLGASIKIAGQIFVLDEMDDHTANYMETNADSHFPKSDPHKIISKLQTQVESSGAFRELSRDCLALESRNEVLNVSQAHSLLQKFVEQVTLHETTTLIRAFGNKGAGTIETDRLVALISP
uniref:EFhand domaincontaining protein putative n=1 Tax=Albugo laibachii Nc14 TaxID=890382 RepID=F0W038_9STRA|nr:EFhand domaincontaining protein putative [Albugo laibachii Nc14]|eukprot:CCA14409.1 EFhand domaincontaining protein putative [Albugo laibachii Nc14]